jgi:hypothetical protein
MTMKDGEDDCKEQEVTAKPNPRSCEYEDCSNEAAFECEGVYCDGSGRVCSLHWNEIDTNYLATGMGCAKCWQEVGIGDAWVVTISDRRVPPSSIGKRVECWNGCKDEKTGNAIMTLLIIMNEKRHDYCANCCTAWVVSRLVEGEN